jgi:uncharacterized protein YigE (DUF2233 family)
MQVNRLLIPLLVLSMVFTGAGRRAADEMVSYVVDPARQEVQFYWKDDKGDALRSIQGLKDYLTGKHKRLVFAMNGGMFKADNSPVGLFISQGKVLTALDTSSGTGNFYLKPNGVLFITTDNKAGICPTEHFDLSGQVRFATQSGPMLLIDGKMHPAFKQGSANVNIRNGVGLLPGNRLLFAMSRAPINFYDFATYFKNKGCSDALYLDGFVSRTYLPEQQWEQTDGNLGVIIGSAVPE